MKILFLSQIVPYPPHGGVLQRGYYILRELGKENDVHLLAFNHSDVLRSEDAIDEAKGILNKFCNSIDLVQLRVKQSKLILYCCFLLSIVSLRPFSVIAHKSKTFRHKMHELLKEHKFDIIHYDTIALAQYWSDSEKIVRTLTHHNIESELMLRRARTDKNLLKKFYFYLNGFKLSKYERNNVSRFDCNITCSEADLQKVAYHISSSQGAVVPNGVDTTYFHPKGKHSDEKTVIHVGALQSANLDGVHFFLQQIWPLIKQRIPDAKFVVVGGNIPKTIIKLVDALPDVILTGYVEDIRPIVRPASVFVVPLRFGGGTKLKVLDAMAMSKAIVTTSIGSEGLEVTPGKHLMVADTPDNFATQVVRLLKTPKLRYQLGQAARQLVLEKYDWSIIGELQRQVFEKCVNKSR